MSATPATGGGGGTQQSASPHHHCSDCGVMFDSAASLQVHLHYHQEAMMSRASWGPPTNSGSPTDPDNNNHAPKKVSNVIAAADSSDNQLVNVKQEPNAIVKIEPQAQQQSQQQQHQQQQQTQQQQQQQQQQAQQQQQQQQQHVITSYHTPSPYDLPPHQQYSPNYGYDVYYGLDNPYMNQDFMGKHSAQQMHQQQQVSSRYQPYQHSPRVSSSSPSGSVPGGACMPSPSPVQCDKCGMVCETAAQLQEHALSHSDAFQYPPMPNTNSSNTKDSSSEILDLDSQKVVYPAVLPSLQGLQGMQPQWHDTQPPPHQLYHQAAFPPQSASDVKLFRTPQDHSMQPSMQQASHPPHMVSPPDFPTTTTPQQHDNGVGAGFRPAGAVPQITSSHPVVAPGAKGPGWKSNEARRPKTYNCTACNKWFTSSGHLKRHYNTTLHKNAVKSSGQPDPANMPISAHHHPGRDPNHPSHHKGANSPTRRLQSQQQRSPEPQGFPPQSQPSSNPGGYILPPHSYGSFTFPGIPPDTGQPPPGGDMNHQQIESNNTTSTTNHLSGSPPNGQAGPSVHNLLPLPRGLQIHNSLTVNTTNIMEEQSMRHMQLQPEVVQQGQDLLLGQSARSLISYRRPRRSPLTITPHTMDMEEDLDQQVISSQLHQADQDQSTTTSTLFLVIPPGNRITNSHHIIGDTNSVVALKDPISAATPLQHQFGQHMDYGFADPLQHPPFSPAMPDQEPSPPSPQQRVTSTEPDKKPVIHRCDACDKQFNKACYLTQHNKSFHSGDKPFKCSRCGKRFQSDALHEEHLAKHAGDKPFKCAECPKQFNHKTDLRRHMCLHSGSKPYACHLCGKGFVRKDHMLKHCETHRKKSKDPNVNKRAAAIQA